MLTKDLGESGQYVDPRILTFRILTKQDNRRNIVNVNSGHDFGTQACCEEFMSNKRVL